MPTIITGQHKKNTTKKTKLNTSTSVQSYRSNVVRFHTVRRKHTCVCEIYHGEEDDPGGERNAEEEERLEFLSGQSVSQVLQEGIRLE